MGSPPAPFPRILGLICLTLFELGCFSGVKYAREDQTCKSGDQVLEGAVACDDDLVCLTVEVYRPGYRRGVCTRACGPDGSCAAGLICAAGACVWPCPADGAQCPGGLAVQLVCCQSPQAGPAACLPGATCRQWGLLPDAGPAGDAGGSS